MSSNPLSFEEYRMSSWHDVCRILGSAENERRRSAPANSTHAKSSNKNKATSDISKLPSPLEPKERLVPSKNPPNLTDFPVLSYDSYRVFSAKRYSNSNSCCNGIGSSLKNSYIMPSSLVPIEPPPNPSAMRLLPPPTAFMDELPNLHSIPSGSKVNTNNIQTRNSEIIEIKRPPSDFPNTKESTFGLDHVNYDAPRRKESLSSISSRDLSERGGLRRGIFDIPEIYSPPPLPVPKSSLKPPYMPRSSILDYVMPSFIENTLNRHRFGHDRRKLHTANMSPRQAHSEPKFKPKEHHDRRHSPPEMRRNHHYYYNHHQEYPKQPRLTTARAATSPGRCDFTKISSKIKQQYQRDRESPGHFISLDASKIKSSAKSRNDHHNHHHHGGSGNHSHSPEYRSRPRYSVSPRPDKIHHGHGSRRQLYSDGGGGDHCGSPLEDLARKGVTTPRNRPDYKLSTYHLYKCSL